MEDPIDPRLAILFAGLLVAAITDIASKRIPNALTFPLLLVGLAVQASGYGDGIVEALKGAGLAFAMHFVLWQMKLEGAGDAKLMMGVGAFLGWWPMIIATLWRYILLIPYAVIVITVKGRWKNVGAAIRWTLGRVKGADVGERPEATYMPFGPLIGLAVLLTVYTDVLQDFLS